jgi:uncharacterized protein YecE (DUF72 family)
MARYYIGTAGWSYKDWDGIVYPQRKPQGFHPLLLLAQYINIVEINSTFYRPPPIQMTLSWIKRVADYPDFLFSVKLHQVFTHKRKGFTQKDIDNFKFGIEPLRAKSKLASILIQFPWSFINTVAHIEYLTNLFKSFGDFPLTLEVRHSSWNTPNFFGLLSEHKICFCNIDQPIFRNSIKPTAISTNPDFSYVRLHGRNYENWFKKNAGRDERYNYLYAKEELEDWVKKIKDLGNQSKKVLVITNNHYRGQALANALQIKNIITNEKVEIPYPLLTQYPVLKEIVEKIKSGQLDLFEEEEEKKEKEKDKE